ncbi:hypothetical protein OSB04_029881, partial [Centaurea solstitialis]
MQRLGHGRGFTFDKVFAHDASQQEVFTEISQLVQSAVDGYKVCIFAYGQTGSGKTYTMMGIPEAPQQEGIIPRSLKQVFQTSEALAGLGWKFKMQASMLEIYNETIRDLLSPRSGIGSASKQYARDLLLSPRSEIAVAGSSMLSDTMPMATLLFLISPLLMYAILRKSPIFFSRLHTE